MTTRRPPRESSPKTLRRTLVLLLALPGLLALWAAPPAVADPLTPPVLAAFDVQPRTVDVTDAAQQITVTVRFPAATSSSLQLSLIAPRRVVPLQSAGGRLTLTGGSPADGVFSGTFTVAKGAAPGLWTPLLAGFAARPTLPADAPAGLTVLNDKIDVASPQVSEIQVNPTSVDVLCAPQTITLSARVADRSGVDPDSVSFFVGRPKTGQAVARPKAVLASGTATDGVFTATATVRQASFGIWDVMVISTDGAGNSSTKDPEEQILATASSALTATNDGSACGTRPAPTVMFNPRHAGDVASLVVSPSVLPPGARLADMPASPRMVFSGLPGEELTILSKTAPATTYSKIGIARVPAAITEDEFGLRRCLGVRCVVLTSGSPLPRVYTRTTSVVVVDHKGAKSKPITLHVQSTTSYPQIKMTDPRTRRTVFSGTVTPGLNGRIVTLYNRGKPWATARTNARGDWSLVRNVKPGSYVWQVRTKTDAYNVGDDSEIAPRPHRFY